MKFPRRLFSFLVLAIAGLSAATPLPTATPQAVGLSAERLQRVDAFMARLQAEDKIAGAVTLVARRGQLVSLVAHGFADREARRPMRTDDILQIQSMTKPIASVAALMLLEEGRFLLSDPVEKFLPEFRGIKVAVAKADAPEGYVLVPAGRPMTIHDLLTHRAGFIGIRPRNTPAEALRRKAREALPANEDYTLEEAVRNLATSPLDGQPGAEFNYGSTATVVLGRILEVVTGRTLDVVLQERIFTPLGMVDTGFSVPVEKQARVAAIYARVPEQGLVRQPANTLQPRYLSAGGGLYSTAADYLRFCQMLLNGGELDGRRIVSRKTVELMTARHVETVPMSFLPGQHFGLGVAVRKADGDAGLFGSPGTYGWLGAYNTYFRIDPREKLILICLAQVEFNARDLELQYGFHNTVLQAIVD